MRLYNTLGRTLAPLVPRRPGRVDCYTCGPTVYDLAHVGNWRTIIVIDVLRRALEREGLMVHAVMNTTDVDDKTIAGSAAAGETLASYTRRYETIFLDDLTRFNVTPPTELLRATEHVAAMIALVERLLERGHAYRATDGIYFRVSSFPRYGALSQMPAEHLAADSENAARKEDPRDFALWKFETVGDNGVAWDAPFGRGRPGWHIECSAMSMQVFGPTFDLHAGGADLVFPHHENEIAQSEAATGEPFARHWFHVAFLHIDGQKMSKSLGNVYTTKDLDERHITPLAYRLWLLGTHYRTPANFTWPTLEGAQTALNRLRTRVATLPEGGTLEKNYDARFQEALQNDLGTPQALALVWELLDDPIIAPADKRATILGWDEVFGLDLATALEPLELPPEITVLVAEREAARADKNWAKADDLRDQINTKLTPLGAEITDTADGQRVVRTR